MDHITVRHIVEAVSGTLLCGDADTELEHISIDSRSMRGADLFVPLIGEKSDAHRFLVQAMDNGAAAALTGKGEKGRRRCPAGIGRAGGDYLPFGSYRCYP